MESELPIQVSYDLVGSMKQSLVSDEDSSSSEEEDDDELFDGTQGAAADSDEELEVFDGSNSISHTKTFTRAERRAPVEPQNAPVVQKVSADFDSEPVVQKESVYFDLEPIQEETIMLTLEIPSEDISAVKTEVKVNQDEDDDEFGWEENSIASNATGNKLSELLRQKKEAREEEEIVDFSEDIRQFKDAVAQVFGPEDATDSDSNVSEGNILTKLRNESLQALQDIVGVYGEGLGDQSILVDEAPAVSSSNENFEQVKPGVLGVISEGDEEEEEEEEEEKIRSTTNQTKPSTVVTKPLVSANIKNIEEEFLDFGEAATDSQITNTDTNNYGAVTDAIQSFESLSYEQIVSYFHNKDLSAYDSKIQIHAPAKASWFKDMLGAKLRYDNCEQDLKVPFLIAEVDYDPFDSFHLNMMRTIYCYFLSVGDLKPIDNRWERIGFQGSDPRTDVNRSMKILSLLQVIHFSEKEPKLAKALFNMSRCSLTSLTTRKEIESTWPFLCVGIMFTKESLSALRQGSLNALCNQHQSSLKAMHLFYEACFIEFGKLLLKYPDAHHAVHLSTVRKRCENDIGKLLKHISDRSAATRIIDSNVVQIEFSNLDEDLTATEEAAAAQSGSLGSRAKKFVAEK